MPGWIHPLAVASLVTAVACALVVVADIARGHRQHMAVMSLVWPMTMLYLGPLGLWAYFTSGRRSTRANVERAARGSRPPPQADRPMWEAVGLAATHCGAGCTAGDLVAETFVAFVPITLFDSTLVGTWTLDYALAFLFGIGIQYATIAPMKGLSPRHGIVAALKADTLSLTAWQLGMYGWMAVVVFGLVGHELAKSDPVFWFMMQIAMAAGLLTSYPVNWWLVASGVKERM